MNDRWRDGSISEMKEEMKGECKIDLPAAPCWSDLSISPAASTLASFEPGGREKECRHTPTRSHTHTR